MTPRKMSKLRKNVSWRYSTLLVVLTLAMSFVSGQEVSSGEGRDGEYGRLTIKTSLRYSEIYVGNEWIATGSIRNMKLVRDIYPIRIETPYFKTVHDTVNLLDKKKASLDIILEPIMGTFELITNASDTELLIEPEVGAHRFVAEDELRMTYHSQVSDSLSMSLQTGNYLLSLTSPGFYPLETPFDIPANDPRRMRVDLMDGRSDYERQRSTLIRKSALFVLLAVSQQVMKDQAGEHYNRYINALTVTDAESSRSKTQFYDGASIITLTAAVGVGAWAIRDYQALNHLGQRIQIKDLSH